MAKPKTQNFTCFHSLELTGSVNSRKLSFVGITKNHKEHKIVINVDDFDLNEMVKLQLQHLSDVEENTKIRLKTMRSAHNYTTNEPVITYEKSNN